MSTSQQSSQCPKVSIIVLNYNGFSHLGERLFIYLKSILSSDYPDLEVLFVDNSSTDNSVAEVKTKFYDNPRFRLIELPRNYGYSGGNNRGFKYSDSKSKYLVIMNTDVMVTGDWLRSSIRLMESERDLGIVGIDQKHLDGTGFYGALLDKLGFNYYLPRSEREIQEVFYVSGALFIIRRDLFIQIGMFDDDFWLDFDEVDLCWRIWLSGYRIIQMKHSSVLHEGGAVVGRGYSRDRFGSRNQLTGLIKNHDIGGVFLYSGLLIILYAAFGGLCAFRGQVDRGVFYFSAIIYNLKKFPTTWRKRHESLTWRKRRNSDLSRMGLFVRSNPFLKLEKRSNK